MDGPARRRHRGKPSPRADRDRRSLGLYRRDVRGRRQRARLDRCRHRRRSRDAAAMVGDGNQRRQRSDIGAAQQRLDAAGRPQRPAQRASRPSAQRIAIDAADVSGGHMVTAMLNDADLRQRAWDAAAQSGRSRDSGADHRRSRRAARRRGHRRPCRGRDHADLFRLPRDEHDHAGNRAGAGARGIRASQRSAPCCRRPGPPTG